MKKDIRPILSLDVYEDSSQQPSKNPTNKAPKSRNKERKKRRSNITFFIYHKTRNRHWICIQVKLSRALSLSPEQYNFKNCNLLTIKSMLQLKDEKCSYEDIQKNQNKTIAGSSSECVKIEYIKVEHSEFQTNLTNNERCHENEQGNIIQNEQCSYEDIQKKQNKTIAGSSSEYVNIGYIKSEHGEFQTNITNNERCHENEQKNKIKEEKCGYEDIHKNQNKTIAEISSECANIKYIKSEHGEFQTNITNNERCHENEQENIIQNEQSSYEDTQKNQTKTIEGSSSECVNIGYINSEPGAFRTYITNNESCHKNEQENKIKKIAITETENLREYPERLMSLLNWQNNILNTLNNQSTVENSKNDHSNSQLTLTYVRTYRRYPAKTRADMIKKVPMTSTERVRKYRERRKSLLNLQNNIFNALNNQSTVENTTNNHSEYRINITDDGKDRENGQVNIIKKVPKTSTERSRESRKRRKALLNLTNNEKCCESKKVKKIKKAPNSSTERVRRYRERRKALLNLINNEKCCENKKAPMSSTERVRKYRERRKQLLNLQNKISNALNYQSTVKNSISDHSESRTNITNDEKCHENEQKNKIKVEKCGYEDIEKNQNKTIAGSSRECVNIEYIKSEHSESRTNITNDEKCREKEQENIIQNEQCSYEDKQKNQNKTIAGSSSECVTIEYIKIDHSESRTNITNDERCHENEQENKIKEESCGSEDIHKNQNKTIAGSLSECVNIEYIKSDHSISQSTLPNAEIYPRCRENMIKKVPKNSTERVRAFRQRRKALLDFQKHFLNTLNSVSTVENIENDDHNNIMPKKSNLENSAGNVAQRTRSKMNYLKKSQEQHDESLEKNIPTKQTMCQNCLTVSKALIQKSSYARTKERSVQPLIVHLENVSVHYIKDNVPRKVPEPPQTTLTEFFKLCQTTDIFGLFARTLIYTDVPHYFIWNYTTKKWVPRIQGEPHPTIANIFKGKTVGQIFHLYSKQPECIFLELLLGKIPGPTSFEYLRTINGKVFSTYQDACRELKLL
ncbi:PREDICTED: centromere-associated protein E-like isoform X6 [Polistes dominula]|uniref:Centromere-associated protein E-like isoform X6 n=1 Tax=Polistes dominula TaxID=743375 RepID=A0ABM1JA41_POLDO|nr:PREDICTED: centromere-associated protein E-like isoform X6 [Polistes dominula]